MKTTVFLFLVLIYSCSVVHSDVANKSIDGKYDAALTYLEKHMQDKPFQVADTLVYISQTAWFNINRKPDSINDIDYIAHLESLDNLYNFKNEYHSFKKSNSLAKFNVYFSKPIDNYLDAEVVNNRGRANDSHSSLTMFNTTTVYRFTFNNRNEVISVKTQKLIYN
ncbi:hypothetical protein GN157_06560 [Flavobacterium rakeshii]|uniref:Uncharacterized protein n=1 Tax=Flavobacterium rakeshii TaxID=1038845 RepID=A0A6N8HEC5_9FLAO|nr:hypothetical protein [Flavobacterium rakeshii]MUV03368.1 hypothetical protein [Flavobacterium rakeshii]